MSQSREPIFNIPAVVVVLLVVLGLIHLVRVYYLSPQFDRMLVWDLAFVPARYAWDNLVAGGWQYGWWLWTFVTYAFLHANIVHLGFNAIWLLAFGGAVARRFSALRFLGLFALTAAAGALAYLLVHPGELSQLVGASGAISGTMGAAARFAFQRGGPLDPWHTEGDGAYRRPAPPLTVVLRDGRVLAFIGTWFGLNLLFGLGAWTFLGDDQSVAWEAHIGGFLAGLVLFSVFDPVNPSAGPNEEEFTQITH